ncbi:unnamed protein product [Blumeria hordei]|uniref:DUF1750-domain-containing protein n=1 Tax=Blumeria hordei TaxID=2867405 RepID=A0A383URT3_BLUHO|nr:unnamed protein product [Blumeria hordei]
MNDPSQGIQRELLPHIHLLSTYRFPQFPQIHPEKISEWLQAAPKISRDQAPFYWTYLDRPQDMTILLVWQSMALGPEFPSDGYIWTPQEMAFQIQVEGGYTLEMYQQKAGYAPGEPMATHTRRRYRLLPPRMPGQQAVQPDPCLWIVHYSTAEPSERIPSNLIPVDLRVQQTMSTRQYLHSQGQIVHKEFMLHDRTNWPSIAFPRNRPQGYSMYGQNVPPARIPQTMAYPPQHNSVGPPAKRIRTQITPVKGVPQGVPNPQEIEEEEDTSRGDIFDHITPREISMVRYKQNHEWMEEIVSSPYPMNRIVPADLGLGIRGELSPLTDGIFDAPLDPDKDVVKHNYVGKLDPEKAEEFRKRVDDQVVQSNNEMEKMKLKHEKRLHKLKKGSIFRTAEKELRSAVFDSTDISPKILQLDGHAEEAEPEKTEALIEARRQVSDIIAQVETSVGRKINTVCELIRIQDGGFEEAIEVLPTLPDPGSPRISAPIVEKDYNQSQGLSNEGSLDINNMSVGILDYNTGMPSNLNPTENQHFSTSQNHLQGYPNTATQLTQQNQYSNNSNNTSINQDGGQGMRTITSQPEAWVSVPHGDVILNENQKSQLPTQILPQVPIASSTPTKFNGFPEYHPSPNEFGDLGDLDSSADALAGFGEEGSLGDLGMDIDIDVGGDLDALAQVSAFGDAFTTHNNASGDSQGGGHVM